MSQAKVDLPELTKQHEAELRRVNLLVNQHVVYQTDQERLRVPEFWESAALGGKGDCEDYALLKQQLLREAEWPETSLRLAVCKQRATGEYHAVLTVDTSGGTYVLCNNYPSPQEYSRYAARGWEMTMRQAATGTEWVSLREAG